MKWDKLRLYLLVAIAGLCWSMPATAQEQNGWSAPLRLSTSGTRASEGYMVPDFYGYMHVFWVEQDTLVNRSLLFHSRFDGKDWSTPIDIALSPREIVIRYVAPAVDRNGMIHLAWAESNDRSYYTNASASSQLTAQDWKKPLLLGIPADSLRLNVDSSGVLHLVYAAQYDMQPGVYYIRSEDGGATWTSPTWLDPDIPQGVIPNWLQFGLDAMDGLHVVWNYVDVGELTGREVRYVHSRDHGTTWDAPFTLDEPDDSGTSLRMAHPSMMVASQSVFVVWGASNRDISDNDQIRRKYRVSSDAGMSWDDPQWMLGDLNGQAAGAGMTVDAAGRVHYATQIRYPQAIWHTYWSGSGWSPPSAAYFIAQDSDEARLAHEAYSRIHAHNVRLATRVGNQVMMTFTDSPSVEAMGLYAMYRILSDVMPVDVLPTPLPTATPTVTPPPTPTPLPTPTLTPEWTKADLANVTEEAPLQTPATILVFSLLPVLLIVSGAVVSRSWRRF